jgi:hypothetical protein
VRVKASLKWVSGSCMALIIGGWPRLGKVGIVAGRLAGVG